MLSKTLSKLKKILRRLVSFISPCIGLQTYAQLEVWLADCPEGVVCTLESIGESYEEREVLMFSVSVL